MTGPPDRVLADTAATATHRLLAGGSPATSWLLDTPRGPLVVKVQRRGAGRVDGHDLDSFRCKPRQLDRLRRERPALAPYFVRPLRTWDDEPDWAAFAMPYVSGVRLADWRGDRDRLLGRSERVFDVLGRYGWDEPVAPAPSDHFDRVHASRLRRRTALLRQQLDPDLFTAGVAVNGRVCRPAPEVLAELGAHPRLVPAGLYFPVHGDLNLGNVLVPDAAPERFTVIDPRGTLHPWDVVYDLAKATFSLSLFEDAMSVGFRIDRTGERSWTVAAATGASTTADAVTAFVQLVAGSELGARLSRTDPHWLTRLAAAHATHCLAEAACRLSDPTDRDLGAVAGPDARRHLATGMYLLGTWLADDLAGGLATGRFDVIDHLIRFQRALRGWTG